MSVVLLYMPERERMTSYTGIELLSGLADDVFCSEIVIPAIDEAFVSGIDDWWPNFVADMYL